MKPPIIILFTGSYPYDVAVEQTFLHTEVEILSRYFDRVILVPRIAQGRKSAISSRVEIETSYAEFLARMSRPSRAFRVLLSQYFYSEVFNHRWLLVSIPALKRLLYFLIYAVSTSEWLDRWIFNLKTPIDQMLFYTYWFTDTPMGIGIVKAHIPGLKIISRAHGLDLFEERFNPPYWPCREKTLSTIDRVFADSDRGTNYLRMHYPKYRDLFQTARLGVRKPGFECMASRDGVFRIASCSMIRPEKRIPLLIEGIAKAAESRPDQKFEWHHIGNGESRESLQALIKSNLPKNATGQLMSYISQDELFRYYQRFPVDVFINVSETEGTPVSIMEAISCGIPVIATAVGGNPEIVTVKNGLLISPNPSPSEIGDALLLFMDNQSKHMDLRRGSKSVWNEKYNAESNYTEFATVISKI